MILMKNMKKISKRSLTLRRNLPKELEDFEKCIPFLISVLDFFKEKRSINFFTRAIVNPWNWAHSDKETDNTL